MGAARDELRGIRLELKRIGWSLVWIAAFGIPVVSCFQISDPPGDYASCLAEGTKAGLQEPQRGAFLTLCMRGKGYDAKTCPAPGPECFERKGFWRYFVKEKP